MSTLTLVAVIVGVVGGLVTLFLFVRAGFATVKLTALREDLDDERKLVASLRGQLDGLEREVERVHARVDTLEAENTVLRNAPRLAVEAVERLIEADSEIWRVAMDRQTNAIAGKLDAVAVQISTAAAAASSSAAAAATAAETAARIAKAERVDNV